MKMMIKHLKCFFVSGQSHGIERQYGYVKYKICPNGIREHVGVSCLSVCVCVSLAKTSYFVVG